MGMAASQARYLSLSARKTNTEYEGQQLNQQRLNIANQSADLFNQMLGMEVPVCPDSNDFTKLQYSWTDGINDEVISDFYQIAVPNENYNYVVTSYRYENAYVGQTKRMNSPEIQASKTNHFTDLSDRKFEVLGLTYDPESSPQAGDDSYTITVQAGDANNKVQSRHVFKRMDSTIDSIEEIDAFTKRTTKATAGDKAAYRSAISDNPDTADVDETAPAQWGFDTAIKIKVKIPNPDFTQGTTEMDGTPGKQPYLLKEITIPAAYTKDATTGEITWNTDGSGAFQQIDVEDPNQRVQVSQLLASYGDKYDASKTYFAYKTDQLDASGDNIYVFICGEDMDNSRGSQGSDISQVEVRAADKGTYYTDGKYILTGEELAAIDLTNSDKTQWLDTIFFHREQNDPTFSDYTHVGNCELSIVTKDTYDQSEDMQIEIQQVIKDMLEGGNQVAYGNLSSCFDPTTGEYTGGIYSFKMYDHTYYTTYADLDTALAGAYKETATATNGIDSQDKLLYYTSTTIPKKIEETKKALMETDGKGRFSSVRFEDDDTVYTLKCETVKDDDAYNNAMNQYFYKQEKYDKAIADLNAKNEIIQAQDRELQLRLEQLGTEQTALQTEMEACQKVVSKSIESTFKTFGG